ncbi:MAG TPA: FxSxx-COOH system tetratricopeptide repeat protein [Ktedonobacteraceae bacterium]|nr:FxSxx-COOH system tetratricopeptide repeat protein [Ktedonobacteraceae bacterium]
MAKKATQAKPNSLLRSARLQRNWTQQEVANRIGAPLALNITRWERGTTTPSAYYVKQLCQLFGKTPQELGLLIEEQSIDEAAPPPSTSWMVSYRRNPYFTGRDAILMELHQQLNATYAAALNQSYAMSGLGGIGKTQIAVEYAYRYQQTYQAIFWVRAASRDTLVTDYVALAKLVGLSGSNAPDQSQVVDATKRWLVEHQGWLLILDNADDLSLLSDFLPQGNSGTLLLTTRAQATGKIAPNIQIDKMELEEACLLLLRRSRQLALDAELKDSSEKVLLLARAIVSELDALPLALDQAGAYIEETGCSLHDYLELYRSRRSQLLRWQSELSSEYPYTVASTWSLSFERVEAANPASADLLRLCAFLDPDAIPEWLLTEGASQLGPLLAPVADDPLSLNEALRVLRSYSLIRRNAQEKMLSLHRLVQEVLKEGMDDETRRQWAEHTVNTVSAVFPKTEFATWTRCQSLLPHANRCAELIELYQFTSPEAGHLLTHAGLYLLERSQSEQAESLLKAALSIREQTLGPEHLDTIATLDILGNLYSTHGHYSEAETLLQRALSIREQQLGPQHPDVATTLRELGDTYTLQGRYEQAEPLLQRALVIREQVLGPKHLETADTLNSLAVHYYYRARYTTAEVFFQRALEIYEQTGTLEHHQFAIALDGLGIIYILQGKYRQAQTLHRRALSVLEKLMGPERFEIGRTLNNLAMACLYEGEYEEAVALFQRSLTIKEKTLGLEHFRTAISLDNLARAYTLQGKYEQAEAMHMQALSIFERGGEVGSETGITLYNLAFHYYLRRKYGQVELLCQRALSIFERVLDLENYRTASVLYLLAQLYEAQGRDPEAQSFYRRAIAMREHVLGPEHPETKAALKDYAAFIKKGRDGEG